MAIPNQRVMSLEEFYQLRESTEQRLEYINGVALMSPSPSTKHQRISGRMYVLLFHFFEKTNCEVFHAPFDIELKKEGIEETNIVIPDLSVICDKSGLTEQKYIGVPPLIVEILSPSNQAHDLVVKLNLYMRYGVQEYWIINPMLDSVQVYALNGQGQYEQIAIAKEKGTIDSAVFPSFSVDVETLFRE